MLALPLQLNITSESTNQDPCAVGVKKLDTTFGDSYLLNCNWMYTGK